MLQRDFGHRIYKALTALPAKDEKKEKEKKAKKEAEKKEAEKREIKKEKDEDIEEPVAKKTKEDEEEKRKVHHLHLSGFWHIIYSTHEMFLFSCVTFVLNQYDEKALKKEDSRDEEENEDDGSMANAEEYDPLEAEDADDDDDDGTSLSFCMNRIFEFPTKSFGQWGETMHHAEPVIDSIFTVPDTKWEKHNFLFLLFKLFLYLHF